MFLKSFRLFDDDVKKLTIWNVESIQHTYINTSLGTQLCQGHKSYSRRLPALERFYRETKISLLKSTHSD